MNNVHYLLIGIALILAIIAIVKPEWPCLAVSVILIAIELFSRMSKVVVIVGLSASLLIGVTGCKTSQTQTAITSESVIVSTVNTAMTAWAQYVNSGKATQVQVDTVKQAYIAYYTAQLSAEAALTAIVSTGSTNNVDIATANVSISNAETALLTLINQYLLK